MRETRQTNPNNPDIKYFMGLRDHIMSNWSLPSDFSADDEDLIIVVLKIRRDGVITGRHVETSTGNREFNEMVFRTIAESAPLPSMPEKMKQDFLEVGLRFTPTSGPH